MIAFALAIFYLAVAYLSVGTVFGSLAQFHVEVMLAGIIVLVSVPALPRSPVLRAPQSLALLGLAFTVSLSILLTGWVGGAVQSFMDFIPCAFAYFLVCLHCKSKGKLQILILMLMTVCLFVLVQGSIDLHRVATLSPGDSRRIVCHYLLAQRSVGGPTLFRLCGQNFLNDPNDLAQLLVSLIPLIFIFWRPKKPFRNLAFVILPVCALLYEMFLTRSRGAVMALAAIIVIAGRRRVGTFGSLLLAGLLLAGAYGVGFTGGRDISVDAGSDRASLWSQGLQVFKAHPLFGVGYGHLSEFTDNHLTAHNSIVVCAAELGLAGLFFWSLFVWSSVQDAVIIASPARLSETDPPATDRNLPLHPIKQAVRVERTEIARLGRLVVLSLTGYLVAAWFLSRAYAMTLFLLGGVAEVVFQMALDQGMLASRVRLSRVLRYAAVAAVGLVGLVYVMVRIMNMMR